MATTAELSDVLEYCYRSLGKLRDQREEMLKAAAGPFYVHSNEWPGARNRDILPLLRQAADAMAIMLAANRPRVLTMATSVERQAFAELWARAINAYAKTMKLEQVLQECVRNGFFDMGVGKVMRADSVPVEIEVDEWMDPGRPFFTSVSRHHLNYDIDATAFRFCSFISDRYRARFEDVINEPSFNSRLRKEIERIGPQSAKNSLDEEWGKRLGFQERSQYEPWLYLADVYDNKEEIIETYVVDEYYRILLDEPLKKKEHKGSETGPYHFLNFGPIPDKTTPSSPAQQALPLHNLGNSLYNKLEDQAIRQKILKLYRLGSESDASRVEDGHDGQFIGVSNPEEIIEQRFDGPDQNVFAFALNVLQQFDTAAGNLKNRLGLGPSADTARQEGMISANVKSVEGHYQNIFISFVRDVVKDLGRLIFTDNALEIPMTREVAPGISVDDPWLPAVVEGSRMGKYEDYDIDIDPYPMAYKSPDTRLAELDQQYQMLLPLVPLLMQQGQMLDIQGWVRKRSELLDNPLLQQAIMPIPEQEPAGGGTMDAGGPREYMHHSDGGRSGGEPTMDPLAMMQAASANNN